MNDTYQNALFRVFDKARENPGHNISFFEICEILLEERNHVLVKDQADMCGIEFEVVNLPI